eukprot:CAMPEP_0114420544 /NCGR_PEP_ID=MMETSP0103-20121206/4612_1 /TAXON_ID=37642 ORGANISM="Paraphysomonas imperforata, Strain PA2" /NCGR_SAMPLE_ID=MMETSP0103 /ASSEMBLY_ACC=CAM_ASM_000201 /LENGTH=74 /DNA_ID=CAMNT_0001589027 /DNA_START=74 /DNA_END=298 /DNA_ORIENTATION=+
MSLSGAIMNYFEITDQQKMIMIVIFVVAMMFLGIRPSSRKKARAQRAAMNRRRAQPRPQPSDPAETNINTSKAM